MGTLLRVPVFVLEKFSEEIKKSGLKSYACVVDRNAESIMEQEFCGGSVVIIGNASQAQNEKPTPAADKHGTIPMRGRAESLNAAAAAAIAIWEMMK